jgi:hypothetical protein
MVWKEPALNVKGLKTSQDSPREVIDLQVSNQNVKTVKEYIERCIINRTKRPGNNLR